MFGPKLKVAAGVVAGAALSGGLAYALPVIPSADGTIHACVNYAETVSPKVPTILRGDGEVRIVPEPGRCLGTEMPIAWNQHGQQGLTGPAGPAGPQGAPGASTGGEAWTTDVKLADELASGPFTTVASLDLPAGSYVVSATAFIGAGSEATDVFCEVRLDGQVQSADDVDLPAYGPAAVHGLAAGTLSAPATATLACSPFGGAVWVSSVMINAVRVGTLHQAAG